MILMLNLILSVAIAGLIISNYEQAGDITVRIIGTQQRLEIAIRDASTREEVEAETAGIDGIKADRESQALITGAALKAMQDSEYSCRWKTESGFVELTAPQILAIADAVRAHVQGCFDRESELLPLIEAATSPGDLEVIMW